MRKLLCVTPLFPSIEKPYYCVYLLQQLKALSKYGFDVSVLVPALSNDFSAKTESFEGIRVIRVSYKRLNDDFARFAKEETENNKYDIIALNLCGLDLIKLFVKQFDIPVAVHFHGLNVWENYLEKYPLYAKLLKLKKIKILNKASAVIGVSDKVKRVAEKHYPANKTYTVYNGVNPGLFYPRKRVDKSTFDIYCVANLIKIKGHEYLISALAEARKQLPDANIRLHLIGDGPLKGELSDLSRKLNIADYVFFEGEMLYENIAEKIGTDCDMFIMPSYFESLGCVYLEAMACKVPASGVRGCGIDEVIEDGVNGFLTDPESASQITEKIVWAVNNPQKLKGIAEEGYNTVLSAFTWDKSGEKLSETYERIITEHERV